MSEKAFVCPMSHDIMTHILGSSLDDAQDIAIAIAKIRTSKLSCGCWQHIQHKWCYRCLSF